MSAKRSVVQLDCGAAQVAAQQLNQLQQCLRRVARGQVQQAIAMSSEAIQMQLEGLGAQSARQALQLRNAGTRLLAEKGQGQVQIGCGDRAAVQVQAAAPGADGLGQFKRATQGKEQAQSIVFHAVRFPCGALS